MHKKALLCAIICYLIWGLQSLYWNLFSDFSADFVLTVRITMSCLVILVFLCIVNRGAEIFAMLKDKEKMKFIIPASIFIGVDWGFYIWAIPNGHLIDSVIGYYLNPMVLFLFGLFLFREKANKWEFGAVVVAFIGVVAFVVLTGKLPMLSLVCAMLFPIYGVLKKCANVDPVVSIGVETLLISPFAFAYMFIFARGEEGLAAASLSCIPLFLGAGVITALPMILYTNVINLIPMKIIGIIQYLGTTIGMLCGIFFFKEDMTTGKWILLICIVTGIVIFTIGSAKKQKEEKAAEEATTYEIL